MFAPVSLFSYLVSIAELFENAQFIRNKEGFILANLTSFKCTNK